MEEYKMTLEDELLYGLYTSSLKDGKLSGYYSVSDFLDVEAYKCRNVADSIVEKGYAEYGGDISQVPKVKITKRGIEYFTKNMQKPKS